ncbi:hypothetical protein E6C76_16705 [Pseudothauera nasutitermitis]|uniref:4Fe-4S ferredoxin-type domain-containing protein n=1 Tax=Pseudothauera nasutitermitis TaxID=2565930 RepID=A0A4S4ASS4_9RHOO|nr:hypothetical protein [Pseudothauera nasutitermitis]THF62904.1 hypothetical protein E6C76_16705 [Pseudothauera nasutitermitis]
MPPPPDSPSARFSALDRLGLNLHAVFDVDRLPAELLADLRRHFTPAHPVRQLILIGNAGRALWASVKAAGLDSADPIDDFSVRAVARWFAGQLPGHRYTLLYPGDRPVGLQALGQLAGWHHATPFMVGILPGWGSWFGYRAALLADTSLPVTAPLRVESPCLACAAQPCIAACPARAMEGGGFVLEKCLAYRRQPGSPCRARCLARDACPVGRAHRYDEDHMRHTYEHSLRMIERHF